MNKLAALLDRDKRALENIGVPAAANVGKVLAVKAHLALEDSLSKQKVIPVIHEFMSHMEPIILDGMVAGHLAARARMIKLATKELARRHFKLSAYDEALKYYQKRMNLSSEDVEKLRKLYGNEAARVTRSASAMVEKKAAESISESLKAGEHINLAQQRLAAALEAAGISEPSPFLCETLCRTGIAQAYAAGQYNAMSDPALADVHKGWQYTTVGDNRVREEHEELDGMTADVENEVWDTYLPPLGFNCVPGETLVSGDVQGALKAFYSGPAVMIETLNGHRLTITVKHPVLTTHGWIPAEQLREGDALISQSRPVVSMLGNSQNQHTPLMIEEVFETLGAHAAVGLYPIRALDLYGDQFGRNSKVHVVSANGILPNELGSQIWHQRGFTGRRGAVRDLLTIESSRALELLRFRADSTARSFIGSLDLIGALLFGHARPLESLGFRLSARDNAMALEVFNNDPMTGCVVARKLCSAVARLISFDHSGDIRRIKAARIRTAHPLPLKPAMENAGAFADFLRNIMKADPGIITIDKVVRIRRREWSGHVYDLQTKQGYFIANGIVISNCRCTVIPLFSDFEEDIPDDLPEIDPEWAYDKRAAYVDHFK